MDPKNYRGINVILKLLIKIFIEKVAAKINEEQQAQDLEPRFIINAIFIINIHILKKLLNLIN